MFSLPWQGWFLRVVHIKPPALTSYATSSVNPPLCLPKPPTLSSLGSLCCLRRCFKVLHQYCEEIHDLRHVRHRLVGPRETLVFSKKCRNEYNSLRETLLEVEKEAMKTPSCASPKSILSAVILITAGTYRTPNPYSAQPPSPFIPVRSSTPLPSRACFHFVDSGRLILPI